MPEEAYIVDAVHTPFGKEGGVFKDTHPFDLGAEPLLALEERVGDGDVGTLDCQSAGRGPTNSRPSTSNERDRVLKAVEADAGNAPTAGRDRLRPDPHRRNWSLEEHRHETRGGTRRRGARRDVDRRQDETRPYHPRREVTAP